jgi:hypothetical protein
LKRSADSPYVYEGRVQLAREGAYRLYVEGHDGEGDGVLEVSSETRADPELANPAVNPELMRQLAELTGGQYGTLDRLPAMLAGMDLAPLKYQWTQRVPLWDGWGALALLTGLLTVEWVLRKWKYLP